MANPLLSILTRKNLVTEREASNIERESKEQDASVESILRTRGLSNEDILAAKGEYLGIPTRIIESKDIPFEILKYIPEESATHYKFVPIGIEEGALEVGIVDPDNIEARDALNFISSKINLPFKLYLISEDDFRGVLETYKGLSGEVTKALSELGGDTQEDADLNKDATQDLTGSKKSGEARVIEDHQ